MNNLSQITEETKQRLLNQLPFNFTALKEAKQNLIIVTVIPTAFIVVTFVAFLLIIGNVLIATAYFIPVFLVCLAGLLSGRKRYIKILNDIISKSSDNQLNYRQYRAFIKENSNFKQEIEKIVANVEKSVAEKRKTYNVVLEEVPVGSKIDVVQALTDLGCTIEVAKYASETPYTLVFSNLTEEQALKNAVTLENFGAKIKIDSVDCNGLDEEQEKKLNKSRKNTEL